MKTNHKNIIRSDAEYTRCFDRLRGVSYTADNYECFSELENMYVDYSAGGDAVESVPGYRKVADLGGRIYGIYPQHTSSGEDYVVVHAGGNLYRFAISDRDSVGTPTPIATIANKQSCGKSFNSSVVILVSKVLYVVAEDGSVSTANTSGDDMYLPTMYRNGQPYEDRNMLTSNYKETYTVNDVRDVLRGSPELVYGNLNSIDMTCSVTGIDEGYGDIVYIPARVRLPSGVYTVTAISPGALSSATMTDLVVNREVRTIGAYAFGSCISLQTVRLAASVEDIAEDAFSGCTALTEIYLGSGLTSIGENAFSGCDVLSTVHYPLDEIAFSQIAGHECFASDIITYRSVPTGVDIAIPIFGPIAALYVVYLNGKIIYDFTYDLQAKQLYLTRENEKSARDTTVSFIAKTAATVINIDGRRPEFSSSYSLANVILSCTECEVFDGRIFLTGSPYAKGVVFCSTRTTDGIYTPTYFSTRDYFNDGDHACERTTLYATQGTLAVCKSDGQNSGSVYFHTPEESSDGTRRYPVTHVQKNLHISGPVCDFNGESVFVTDKGIFGIRDVSGGSYSKPVCRTDRINSAICGLLGMDTHLCEWEGYLVVQTGGTVYLGDPKRRRGEGEGYDWYPLTDIGAWYADRKTYRYSTCEKKGYHLHPLPDSVATGTLMSTMDPVTSEPIYYIIDYNLRVKYLLYYSGERFSGTFDPAYTVASTAGLLFFGTERGVVCVFNNDKRGIAPDEISSMADFDAEKYSSEMYNKIHPLFYSRLGHPVKFLAATPNDDCEIPYLEKRTARGSEVAVLKSFCRGSISCVRVNDKEGSRDYGIIPTASFGFENVDFRTMSFEPAQISALTCSEGDSGWLRKRIVFYSDEYCRPFGIHSVSYRYKIKGKPKER